MVPEIVEEIEPKVKPKPKTKTKYRVVKELPVQQMRQSKDEETGEVIVYLTIEEALGILVGGEQ